MPRRKNGTPGATPGRQEHVEADPSITRCPTCGRPLSWAALEPATGQAFDEKVSALLALVLELERGKS